MLLEACRMIANHGCIGGPKGYTMAISKGEMTIIRAAIAKCGA